MILSILTLAIAAALAYWAKKILAGHHWFLAWLRGTLGLLLLLSVAVLIFIALDIFSYRQLSIEKNIATISFQSNGQQYYTASFAEIDGDEQIYELYGDQWQLDSRIIKWQGVFSRLGLKTGYRLDRLSGRYLSLADEQSKKRSVYELRQSLTGVDVWHWLKRIDGDSIVDARYGNSTFLPMVDGAQYQISVSVSGLLARPLNQPAKEAVAQWQ